MTCSLVARGRTIGLLTFGIRSVVPLIRRVLKLLQSAGNVLRSPSIDSLAFDVSPLDDISAERSNHPICPQAISSLCVRMTEGETCFIKQTSSH
ncbi:hypothetical protein AVEN_48525-1 [Araneus ventricosus]|uniref:Uncharacterized protein n=1 Tax=Araneus ventricosus TaxID=182803 RepID=A0A4Y2MVK3_ARAVE|nr:hypothetical protein AVEN_48525-1 [Araneus ventricosus]